MLLVVLLSGCGSNSGPSDADAQNVLWKTLHATNVVIKDKQPCDLSANTKAEGVSERWIITYDAAQEGTGTKATIQKSDGQWEYYSAGAQCSR